MSWSLDRIKNHWQGLARAHGDEVLATTKTPTAKDIEIDALTRAFRQILADDAEIISVLEVGCGNGRNCIALATTFPRLQIVGFDYLPEMIAAAEREKELLGISGDHLRFLLDDVMELEHVGSEYDLIFTDRCLINLNTLELQKQAISALCTKLRAGGYFLMIENSKQTHDLQNQVRASVGLPPRTPAAYNLFFDEEEILPHIRAQNMELIETEDFISLHDLMLYVLVPLMTDGEVDYAHPLVAAATRVNIAVSKKVKSGFGSFGQNRLYVCRKNS